MPEWFRLLRAARYLGVAPWELLRQPLYWQEWALTAEAVDAEVERILLAHRR